MVQSLGLANVPAGGAGVTRFATLDVLRNAVKVGQSITGLDVVSGNNLDISFPTCYFTAAGTSGIAGRSNNFAVENTHYSTAQRGPERGRATNRSKHCAPCSSSLI